MKTAALIAAVILALTGTAFAGGYIITSTWQIKPSVRKALKGNRGPRGLTGAQGPPGPVVANAPTWVDVVGTVPPGSFPNGGLVARCPDGMGAITGTWSTTSGIPTAVRTDGSSWTVVFDNRDGTTTAMVRVSVACAPHGQALAAP